MDVWMYYIDSGEKKLAETTQEFYVLFWTNPGSITLQNSSCTATYLPSHKPFSLDKQDMLSTIGEVKTNT